MHKLWIGETSANVTLWTADKGLVVARYQGARSPKKQALLQPFTALWITLDERRYGIFLRQLDCLEPSVPLIGQSLFAGLYINELLYLSLAPHEPHPTLFLAYKKTLHALLQASDRFALEIILRRFEWCWLEACGYQMSLTTEADSGRPIQPQCHYIFMPGEGFVLAKQGFLGAHIQAFAQEQFNEIAVLRLAKQVMRQAVQQVLDGKVLKTRQLFSGLAK